MQIAEASFPENLVTTETVARMLGKSARTIRQWAAEGVLPAVSMPCTRGYRYRPSEIDQFVSAYSVGPLASERG
ncbi:helix-turn-helix domain-containing protein [Terriglobus sp. TAA 43]|uniref:helix-turn-helix domain-containing protein n=1 Tax=Terriglobus sp. TAA 43 TaxID=278961 RepID=UPI000646087A